MSLTEKDLQRIRQIVREEVKEALTVRIDGRKIPDMVGILKPLKGSLKTQNHDDDLKPPLYTEEGKLEPIKVLVGDTMYNIKPEVVKPLRIRHRNPPPSPDSPE